MCTAGVLALLFDIEILAELVSIGALVVFTMVNCGILFRRVLLRPSAPMACVATAVAAAASWCSA
jgi:hypothetical protein